MLMGIEMEDVNDIMSYISSTFHSVLKLFYAHRLVLKLTIAVLGGVLGELFLKPMSLSFTCSTGNYV